MLSLIRSISGWAHRYDNYALHLSLPERGKKLFDASNFRRLRESAVNVFIFVGSICRMTGSRASCFHERRKMFVCFECFYVLFTVELPIFSLLRIFGRNYSRV